MSLTALQVFHSQAFQALQQQIHHDYEQIQEQQRTIEDLTRRVEAYEAATRQNSPHRPSYVGERQGVWSSESQ